ncbi:putative reductase or dehydrogenase protein, Short-chain dehydrogenase/reductase SDR (plasmid) [Cupriavidus taiwanensis]|uniref:Putative reductase or dehydrogenase protein, Short-chain dehydrogenase/reductase SDR n=1 Tax=Cupriavidus taiwanensis TaxID=164546 RepID=A0A375ILR7_9BURK|nr:SDR family oxidoreductase [Cupriavidus taiwanensis]SOY72313.1 putative reductase or dehydrogenase protein, Short-chain dehydrogenase/reductase SDR [Cupriavidus taiwanensis]SOY72401.1 putative reductase or dehydrogenase protein, Short-chain dehydrogenase/reductase SDR [Cupriavidus taiwanensis]SOY95970.1 putative reductase or dehydrogenase protein, Short-chain dehydrogenase/reductase SDR [Cupriavidus taiwanensis]SOZ75093.1 putative reductase or dehydrogenase protein, Short-chain dehydrogenase/
MGICDGRTVIITGAGGGLGRAYALAFGAEGANVVVNDIRREAAEAVCAEIRAAGGSALASDDDITQLATAQRIVDAAVAAFGEVHVLVNNAGICRDRMFVSLTESDWDEVMRVHLRGHFCLANLLARRWRDAAKAGRAVDARIINTSSGAGLQGSVGQSNYAAAKAGIAALTLVQAAELGRYGITANALAPAARTGMTEQVFADMMKAPAGGFDYYDPANVAPLVVWLGSADSARVNGRMFEAAGGMVSVADGWRTGPKADKGGRWQPAEVGAAVAGLLAQAQPPQAVYGS